MGSQGVRGEQLETLFEREDLDSSLPEDARHWIGVYSNLLHFCRTFEAAEPAGAVEPSLLRRHCLHFEQRLSYWQARLEELQAPRD